MQNSYKKLLLDINVEAVNPIVSAFKVSQNVRIATSFTNEVDPKKDQMGFKDVP